MKSSSVFCLVAALAAVRSVCGFGIAINRVEPSDPWDGSVALEYTVSANADEVLPLGASVSFGLEDTVGGATVAVSSLFPKPTATVGRHCIRWDADADGATFRLQSAKLVARLTYDPQPAYMVIDVSGGSESESFHVTYLNAEPADGFNVDAYKGDKIVLRRVPAGSYVSGARPGELVGGGNGSEAMATRTVSAFYIGIFEMTQKQYVNASGSTVACANPGDYYPRDRVSWEDVRGVGRKPTDPVLADSFAGLMSAKCRAADENGGWTVPVGEFDVPSEWEWEYACRAGTETPYNSGFQLKEDGNAYIAELKFLGRFIDNVSDGKGGSTSKSTTVGSYEPNAWGLYDMHGNVWEWCREDAQNGRRNRGGCSGHTHIYCKSSTRVGDAANYRSDYGGFRLYTPDLHGDEPPRVITSEPVVVAFDFGACPKAQAAPKVVKLDSRSGVRAVIGLSEIFPFAYSQTNFTGVAGADAQSRATVSVVQLSGEGEDVSAWTQEVAGTRRVLISTSGEGTVKWSPTRGVWRAEFVIRNGDEVVHEESAFFDLRRLATGLVIFLH